MHPSPGIFDRSDLIFAWLRIREYRNAHEDLRIYHEAVNRAFINAFGINLDIPPSRSPTRDKDGLHGLFLQVASAYEGVRSPFSSYMCGTPEISELYHKYKGAQDEAEASMRHLYMMMLLELVERIWGGDAPHRVSQDDLDACGHPVGNAPDPFDYW